MSIHSTWYGRSMSVDVDMDDIAKDFAEYIDEEGPYPIHYCGCDCELILVKHKKPAPLDTVLKAIEYQLKGITEIKVLIAIGKSNGTLPKEDFKEMEDKIHDIEEVCKALENEWKDCYMELVKDKDTEKEEEE